MEPYATADQVWAGGLIFARVGAILMLIPGVGEAYVPVSYTHLTLPTTPYV